MNLNITDQARGYQGFFKAWKTDPKTGKSELIVDKKNTILFSGADLLAYALAGEKNSKITHFYLSYDNITNPAITPVSRDELTFEPGDDQGYGRIALSFPPSYTKSGTDYDHNIVIFTITVTDVSNISTIDGEDFASGSRIYEAGLVACATSPNASTDPVFARVRFNPIAYDPSFNLTISWGVKFSA